MSYKSKYSGDEIDNILEMSKTNIPNNTIINAGVYSNFDEIPLLNSRGESCNMSLVLVNKEYHIGMFRIAVGNSNSPDNRQDYLLIQGLDRSKITQFQCYFTQMLIGNDGIINVRVYNGFGDKYSEWHIYNLNDINLTKIELEDIKTNTQNTSGLAQNNSNRIQNIENISIPDLTAKTNKNKTDISNLQADLKGKADEVTTQGAIDKITGAIEVGETVVGDYSKILMYDKNGNATGDLTSAHSGTFRVCVQLKLGGTNIMYDNKYLLMEQIVEKKQGSDDCLITQIILNETRLRTRSFTSDTIFLPDEDGNLYYGDFDYIDLTPIDNLETEDTSAPLSANMGRKLNEEKEDVNNKVSEFTDENTDDIHYPSTKLVKDYVDSHQISSDVANALKETVVGKSLEINEISPIKHDLSVKLTSDTVTDFSSTTVKMVGKNILPYPYYHTTQVINGVTFTVNDDGTVIANGTATNTCMFRLIHSKPLPIEAGDYTLSGAPTGGKANTYCIQLKGVNTKTYYDVGKGVSFSCDNDAEITAVLITIFSGIVCDNLIFKPQIEKSKTVTPYEKYAGQEIIANADGTVCGFVSTDSIVYLSTDNESVSIECEYNADINHFVGRSVNTEDITDGAITFDKISSSAINNIVNYGKIELEYIKEEIERVQSETLNKMGELNFVFSTDQHIDKHLNTLEKIKEVAELADVGQFDFVAMGGDLINGDPLYWTANPPILHTRDSVINQIKICSEIMNGAKCPVFFLQGNHDTNFPGYNRAIEYNTENGYTEGTAGYIDPDGETITSKEWFRLTNNKLGETVVWDADNPYGGYFYKDFNRSKIRVVCLQTNDVFDENYKAYQNPNYPFVQQKQFDWFCNKALNFMDKIDREEWAVITISHADPFYASIGGLFQNNDTCSYNQCQSFQRVLNAFINGTTYSGTTDEDTTFQLVANVDFTQQGAMEFICSINGHSHGDMAIDIPLLSVSRPTIQTANASSEQKDYSNSSYITSYERIEGNITSELFDIFSIDRVNRKIKTIRFGAGADREIKY